MFEEITEKQKNDLLVALSLGRKKRPDKIKVDLFQGKRGACALGAIAVGLGISPHTDPNYVYSLISDRTGISADAVCMIYRINDDAYNDGLDPDQEVIKFIKGK